MRLIFNANNPLGVLYFSSLVLYFDLVFVFLDLAFFSEEYLD